MTFKINKIVHESTAEVEDCIADVVFFQGCLRNCPWCFNPECKDPFGGRAIEKNELFREISNFSDAIVLSGGEPLMQPLSELCVVIRHLKHDYKVVLETSFFNSDVYSLCDKVLYGAKVFCVDVENLREINDLKNVMVCVVIKDFMDSRGLLKIMKNHSKEVLYYRFVNDVEQDDRWIINYGEQLGIEVKKFDKIRL